MRNQQPRKLMVPRSQSDINAASNDVENLHMRVTVLASTHFLEDRRINSCAALTASRSFVATSRLEAMIDVFG